MFADLDHPPYSGPDDFDAAAANVELVAELHRRQEDMYAGGPVGPVADLLADDVVWHVPGDSPVAGEHRGWEAVLRYFSKLRVLACDSVRMRPREVVAADRDVVVQMVEAAVTLDGQDVGWRTVGLYRVDAARVRQAWLVPLNLELYDRVWTELAK